jgi:hypothetical protein
MMQQSAGLLLAPLAVIYSIISAFLSQQSAMQMLPATMALFLPTFVVAISFTVAATCYFFSVITPKKVTALAPPTTLHRELRGNMPERAAALIQILSENITSLHGHVEANQKRYGKGLNACKAAFFFTGLLVAIFLTKPLPSQVVINTYHVSLTIAAIACVCVVLWSKARSSE